MESAFKVFSCCQRIVLFLVILWSNTRRVSAANGRVIVKDGVDVYHEYGCVDAGSIAVSCPFNEVITISKVMYGVEPTGCGTKFTEPNDCQKLSTHVTKTAQTKCDGEMTCKVTIVSPGDPKVSKEVELGSSGCKVGDMLHQNMVRVNYMVVKYTCRGFEFCEKVERKEVKGLTVVTKDFPQTIATNPTCSCTFSSEGPSLFVQAVVHCNGTVTIVAEESFHGLERLNSTTKRYFCKDVMPPSILRIGSRNTVSLKVHIDAKNSSEYSSLSMYMLTTYVKMVNGRDYIHRKPGAKTIVSCVDGSLFLPYTVKLILYITVPLGLVIVIALIVLCCVIKKRRRRARAWRRKHVALPYDVAMEDTGSFPRHDSAARFSYPSPMSPLDSDTSSTPPSTRRKPDGKLDSDSEEDLKQLATSLHRQNTQRRIEELRRREAYAQEGRPYIPRAYSPDLDRFQNPPVDHQIYADRRSRSIGNMPPVTVDNSSDDDDMEQRPLNRTKSASNSRSNVRSVKRKPPHGLVRPSAPPPPTACHYAAARPVHTHRQYEGLYNHDTDDPDLVFDDPRDGDRSRELTPLRDPRLGRTHDRQLLYGEHRCMSSGNLRHPRGAAVRPNQLQGTRSASQSRTSIRSMKRKAPLPPAHVPAHSPASSTPGFHAPHSIDPRNNVERPMQSKPTRSNGNPLYTSSNFPSNGRGRVQNSTKPKYFNPFAVRPPIKPKPKNPYKSGSFNNESSAQSPTYPGLPNCEPRRYSDDGSLDESEHGLDASQPVGVFGSLENMDNVSDGDVW